MILTAETYPIEGHPFISKLTLADLISMSNENIVQSIRADLRGLLGKYQQLLHSVIEQIYECAMEHTDRDQKVDFIEYRLG